MPVTNPIAVEPNANYGGPEGYNKYSPLHHIDLDAGNVADYNFLVDNRKDLLNAYGAFPAELTLAMTNWAARIADENAGPKNPPLVVISSNRSRYIQAGLATVDAQLVASGGIANFNNISDLRAFAAATPSPPIYCPKRLDPAFPRNVYIVVHYSEYADYQQNVARPGIHIVGYAFTRSHSAPNILTGFGASRYAAIGFCKHLRDQAAAAAGGNAPWGAAWLFDDNVVGLTSLQSLNAVEVALGNAICAGFRGLAQPQNRTHTQDWIDGVPPNQRQGQNIPPLPNTANNPRDNGLVQQAACWNIAQLQAQNLNFSPIFVASKEDVSFANYFDATPVEYKFYGTKNIRKETVTLYDTAGQAPLTGSNAVNAGRASYTHQFAYIESATPIQPPAVAPATTLRPYIDTIVVPGAAALANVQADVPTLRKAECQAIESVITRAIKGTYSSPPPPRPAGHLGWVGAANLAAIYSPATVGGDYSDALTVTQRDVP